LDSQAELGNQQTLTEVLKVIPDIHGWPADKVQALQQAAAAALGRPVVFRDPETRVPGVEKIKIGERLARWHLFSPNEYEPIYKEREITVTVAPPEMVIIPAGSFLMGSPKGEKERNDNEGPQHQVTFSRPFAIGRYAVTFDEYDAFCAATGREKPKDEKAWGRGRRPVINVSPDDAVHYCWWLSAQTGQTYRLPSEAEWEYACRAGTTTPFHFGETISPYHANFKSEHAYGKGLTGPSRKQTVPVGSFPANPWGIYEMHGNVDEWTASCLSDGYAGTETDGSAYGSGDWERRVYRGGCCMDHPQYMRSAFRSRPECERSWSLGFRVVRTLTP
jgi:formylglycine-generating enzyme required for sulfatase activity